MKKSVKYLLILLFAFSFWMVTFIVTVNIRGNCDNYSLPDGFGESVEEADTSRDSAAYARIMSANLLANYASWGGSDAHGRAKIFFGILDAYNPDVVAIQEMSNQWYCCITKNCEKYKLVYPVSSGLLYHMTGLLYNTQAVTLLDCGRKEYTQGDDPRLRRVVWVYFENKKTGTRYVVTSTHFDLLRDGREREELEIMRTQAQEQVEIAQMLREKYGCSVYCAGDFNAMDNGGYDNPYLAPSVYNKITESLKDTKYIAQSKTQGDSRKVDRPTFDHIFLLGNDKILRYSILSDQVMSEMSDHFIIFADVAK